MLRLDKLLVERGLAVSRERAQSLILAGRVLVNEQKLTKAGTPVADDAAIRMLGDENPFVSRGGLKLQAALEHWHIDVHELWCADIGASTGGFTDCLLQSGASGVVAADTGYGQMAVPLRDDRRLRLLERSNARLLEPGSLHAEAQLLAVSMDAGAVALSFFCMDVSFISATLVLAPVLAALAPAHQRWRGAAVVLVKPQFEAGREWVGKGGIVRESAGHAVAVERVRETVRALGGGEIEVIDSPITGTEGNREFLLHASF